MPTLRDQIALRTEDRFLIYGIGNVGRQDDGLGIRVAERVGLGLRIPAVVETGYQLSIEDALLVSKFDLVIFVDATLEKGAVAPFSLRPILPASEIAFSTHEMSPEAVLGLCEELYGARPRAFLMAVPGYEWEIREELSERAQSNLEAACVALLESHYA
jgi:hydrogenase maturation protease